MTELLTSAQMRAIEGAAIDSGAVTGRVLMERAGQGVVEAIFETWPALGDEAGRALVLCGPGNNGGDGFVVARLLAARGWAVEVFLAGEAGKLPPDARAMYEMWCDGGGVVTAYEDASFRLDPARYGAGSLLVDALFGTGLTRPVLGFDGFATAARDCLRGRDGWRRSDGAAWPGARVVAVDLPSGLDADSGYGLVADAEDAGREEIAAELTVSFHAAKLGHHLGHGPRLCGQLVIKDIGLVHEWDAAHAALVEAPTRRLGKRNGGHKFSHGHALVLAGGAGRGGAARLAARAALRVGAGLVTVGVPHEALAENAARLDAVMLREIGDDMALARMLEDGRINALLLGPGLGIERARDLVPVALETGRALVLDADALSAYAVKPALLFDRLNGNAVLTPHMGEFRRLFPDLADRLTDRPTAGPAVSKVEMVRAAALRAGAVVLLKGADTVIAHPDGQVAVQSANYARAAPWLATAGAGDVLAGIIAGLMARSFSPMRAATTGAWLHVEAARAFGPGLIAEDLPEALPGVFRALEL